MTYTRAGSNILIGLTSTLYCEFRSRHSYRRVGSCRNQIRTDYPHDFAILKPIGDAFAVWRWTACWYRSTRDGWSRTWSVRFLHTVLMLLTRALQKVKQFDALTPES